MQLTNKAAVRRLALQAAQTHRPAAGFNRVSATFFEAVEAHVKAFVIDRVTRTPSIGKTLK